MIEQLTLPYEEITLEMIIGRSTREKTRKDIKIGRQSVKIPFTSIEIRPGYNVRDEEDYSDEEIKDMALSLLRHGQKTEMRVDVLKDGRILLEQGHRRFYAIQYLIRNKIIGFERFEYVNCFINDTSVTELDRLLNLDASNMHAKPLKPWQRAKVAYRIKFIDGKEKPNREVAELMAISRQTADLLIQIAEQTDDVKLEMKKSNMSLRACIDYIKSLDELQEQADKKEEDSLKTYSGPLSDAPDPLKQELHELAELQQATPAEEWAKRKEEIEKEEAEEWRIERERLLEISEEVLLSEEFPNPEFVIGKRLARHALRTWKEDFVDEDTGEVVTIERNEIIHPKDAIIEKQDLDEICDSSVRFIFVYKDGCYIPLPPKKERKKREKGDAIEFDTSREEIEWCNDVIGLLDQIDTIAKDLPEGVSMDISNKVEWSQRKMENIRLWISKNKKR